MFYYTFVSKEQEKLVIQRPIYLLSPRFEDASLIENMLLKLPQEAVITCLTHAFSRKLSRGDRTIYRDHREAHRKQQ